MAGPLVYDRAGARPYLAFRRAKLIRAYNLHGQDGYLNSEGLPHVVVGDAAYIHIHQHNVLADFPDVLPRYHGIALALEKKREPHLTGHHDGAHLAAGFLNHQIAYNAQARAVGYVDDFLLPQARKPRHHRHLTLYHIIEAHEKRPGSVTGTWPLLKNQQSSLISIL